MKLKKILLILFLIVTFEELYSKNNELDYSKINDVFNKLINVIEPPKGYLWPPTTELTTNNDLYALTSALYNEKSDKFGFSINLSTGIISNLIGDDENILAFILGHEIAHIIKGHLTENNNYGTILVHRSISIEEEFEADIEGLKYAVESGFSYKKIINSLKSIALNELNQSGYECLSQEHPPWSDRLRYLDSNSKDLWKILSTYKNGTFFLSMGQFEPAIYCFQNVTENFPRCYEAHANLGYAKLMNYIELLEHDDFKDLNIAQIVTGCYYNNSNSINTMIRGIDLELWWEAIAELKLSLSIKEEQPLVKSNLALAYLVSPLKNIDIGKALEYLTETLSEIDKDTTLNDIQIASIYLNAGVLYSKKNGSDSEFNLLISKADSRIKKFAEFHHTRNETISNEINSAIKYSMAINLQKYGAKDSLIKAKKILEDYLLNANVNTYWWESAYEKYSDICTKLNLPDKNTDYFKIRNKNKSSKPILGIKLLKNKFIHLSQQRQDVIDQLKNFNFSETTIIPGKNLKKIKYENLGMDIIASDYIFAIILKSSDSPELILNNSYSYNKKEVILRVGLPINKFESLTGIERFTENDRLINLTDNYRYYPEIGIAVKINKKNQLIDEIVIVSTGN